LTPPAPAAIARAHDDDPHPLAPPCCAGTGVRSRVIVARAAG